MEVHFSFSAKEKRTKKKTRGCVTLLLKLVLTQCHSHPKIPDAAFIVRCRQVNAQIK